MREILLCLLVVGLVHASQYEDFFHMPSSESPLGGRLRMPRLQNLTKNRGEEVLKEGSLPNDTPILPIFGRNNRVDAVEMETEQRAPFTSILSASSPLRSLLAKATTVSVKIIAPVAIAAKLTQQVMKVYVKWRENVNASTENGAPEVRRKRRLTDAISSFMGESTHEKLDKIQKDQEECWRVLHSVYKKHSSLEELIGKKLEESTEAVLSATKSRDNPTENINERLALMEQRFTELDSLLTSIQSSVDKELSSLATKKELEEMVGLMKSFVEQLKVAISDGNGV